LKVWPIVEGHGEVQAFPVLLRRLRDEAEAFEVDIAKPIRRRRSELVQEEPLRNSVRLAMLNVDCDAVLVLFDGDDDCPARLAPQLLAWMGEEAGDTPCAVAIAHREYEAWFLAALEPEFDGPESVRDAKGALESLVGGYLPTVDQASHSAGLNLPSAYRRSRSFRHLVGVFDELVRRMGAARKPLPPAEWLEGAGA
jgi:hypothetical protein